MVAKYRPLLFSIPNGEGNQNIMAAIYELVLKNLAREMVQYITANIFGSLFPKGAKDRGRYNNQH